MKKSGNKAIGDDKAKEQIRTSTPNGSMPDRKSAKNGEPETT